MDVSTSTSDVAQKTNMLRQVLGCLKKLVYDWLLQKAFLRYAKKGVAHLWIRDNIELIITWGCSPPNIVHQEAC